MVSFFWGQGHAYGNSPTACIPVHDFNRPAMSPRHRIDKREAKPMPGRSLSFYTANEEMLQHVGLEPVAVIFEHQVCRFVSALQRDTDTRCRNEVFQFVVEQVGDHTVNETFIADHDDSFLVT